MDSRARAIIIRLFAEATQSDEVRVFLSLVTYARLPSITPSQQKEAKVDYGWHSRDDSADRGCAG